MIMIVACHISSNRGLKFVSNSDIAIKEWFRFIFMGGARGNDIFVLISGYLLITSKHIKWSRLLNLWLRIVFYSATAFLIFSFCGLENFSIKAFIKTFFPITQNRHWFATIYFMFYVLHVWLNILLNSLTVEEYKKFLTIITICWSIIPAFTNMNYTIIGDFLNFVYLYSLGGYVKLWIDNVGGKKYIMYGVMLIAINFIVTFFIGIAGIKSNFIIDRVFGLLLNGRYGMLSPINILATLFLLIGFKDIKISHNKIINIMGAATFGVYLIHCDKCIAPFLWSKVFEYAPNYNSFSIIPYSILVILLVYFTCSIIEIMRSKIFKTLSRGYLS